MSPILQDWDVENYRAEHEPEDQWELRRDFMLEHKHSIGEDELVCLAQVFTNMEFMGCSYPLETMKRVAVMSESVARAYREKRKNKLKRTFVKASDAAEQKAKRFSK